MCGRFNVTDAPGVQDLLDILGIKTQLPLPQYNVAPTEDVFLIHDGKGMMARWWLTLSWSKEVNTKYSMFNARCETLTTSNAFKRPLKRQRGIVPISSFLEWRAEAGEKQPWLITNDSEAMTVAALWDVWEGQEPPLLSCTIITTDAAPEFEPWHNRMPVMLTREECERWLDNGHEIAANEPLFAPALKYDLTLVPVNKSASNSRNKSADIMAPIGEPVRLPGKPA